MAAELEKVPGLDTELIEGHRGIFDVAADGKVIFSKKVTGRFPRTGEIPALLASGNG